MWSILKADIIYNSVTISFVYAIAFILFFLDILSESVDVYMMMGVTTLSFYAGMWIIGASDNKEKRDRHQNLIPLPIKEQAFVRLIFCILFQAGITILWFILFFIKYVGEMNALLWDILSFNALNVIVVMPFVIFSDLGHSRVKAHRWVFLALVLFLLVFLIYLSIIDVLQYPLSFGSEIRKTPLEAFVYSIVCVGLIIYDYRIFLKRTSYLN